MRPLRAKKGPSTLRGRPFGAPIGQESQAMAPERLQQGHAAINRSLVPESAQRDVLFQQRLRARELLSLLERFLCHVNPPSRPKGP